MTPVDTEGDEEREEAGAFASELLSIELLLVGWMCLPKKFQKVDHDMPSLADN